MSDAAVQLAPAVQLVRSLAAALAADRRVLLRDDDIEALQALAGTALKELVMVTALADADTPAGQTAHGAPLRMRPDWRERPRSKDLIVDPAGEADPAEVDRILKKDGLYLTTVESPALASMAARWTVAARRVALLVGGAEVVAADLEAAGAVEGPAVFVGARHADAPLPSAVVGLAGEALVDAAAMEAELAAARQAAEQARAMLEADLGTAREAAEAAHEALQQLKSEHESLEADFDAARNELAERRVRDRRVDLVEQRFDGARQALETELEEFRARLRELSDAAEDRARLVADRDAARAAWETLAAALGGALVRAGVPAEATPPASAGEEVIDAWRAQAEARLDAVIAQIEEARSQLGEVTKARDSAARRARSYAAALEKARAEATDPPRTIIEAPAESARVAALEQRAALLEATLEAERSLRLSERNELLAARRAAMLATGESSTLRAALSGARQAAAEAALSRASAEETTARAEAELVLRAARQSDLEEMVSEHARMGALLHDALRRAEDERDQARTELAVAEENLRILRGEFERLRDVPEAG